MYVYMYVCMYVSMYHNNQCLYVNRSNDKIVNNFTFI